ncbi:hypothetical protein G9F31_15260 [Acinetobacter sp. 187]|uniref:hypothetical protein n=1 Tax=Acinetobacter lanii TaxID=2715163 RepID=UPI00140722AD|nr:hypothetical protein [Acinetobacter lanii]NHC05085.1 hypothetical protein [Acinetobacter lanii]
MSAERYILFKDPKWLHENEELITENLEKLRTFVKNDKVEKVIALKESKSKESDWDYDVRFIFRPEYIFLEISAHGPEITNDLKKILNWIRSKTEIKVQDEDGVVSDW